MEPNVLIALITGGATVIVASIGAGVSIFGFMSQGAQLKTIQKQTDGLMAHAEATAMAKGVEEGHAAGVEAGVAAGAKAEQDRVK